MKVKNFRPLPKVYRASYKKLRNLSNFSFSYLLPVEGSFKGFYLTVVFDSFFKSFLVYNVEES